MKKLFFAALIVAVFAPSAAADYAGEIRDQIKETGNKFIAGIEPAYFRDMGIIARKADDAGLYDLTSEIVKSYLFERMEKYLEAQIEAVNNEAGRDPYEASRRIGPLLKYERYYEPSQEFLSSSAGQGFSAGMARQRQEALEFLKLSGAQEAVLLGLQAMHKTGLFATRRQEEDREMEKLMGLLSCTLGWKKNFSYKYEQEFKTDYEKGTLTEDAEFTLETVSDDYLSAKWSGPWNYRYTGRDGEGQGATRATLKYRRGDYSAELFIEGAKLSSAGRFNFPANLSGEKRVVEVTGTGLKPQANFIGQAMPLTGCREVQVVKQPVNPAAKKKVLVG